MATNLARKLSEKRKELGKMLRRIFVNASNSDCQPLTFGDLKKGDRFIYFPIPGDNSGHGGFLSSSYIFIKIDEADPLTPAIAIRLCDASQSMFPDTMLVIKVE